jgi:hypothetical protein
MEFYKCKSDMECLFWESDDGSLIPAKTSLDGTNFSAWTKSQSSRRGWKERRKKKRRRYQAR